MGAGVCRIFLGDHFFAGMEDEDGDQIEYEFSYGPGPTS
jgi:hypothetical protein